MTKLLLSRSTIANDPELLRTFLHATSEDMHFLRGSYPKFDEWLRSKVIPGIALGERTIIVEQRLGTVVGLLILKHTDAERKLSTLRVRPNFENKGLGLKMFELAFELLGTERPLLSVAKATKPKFDRLFAHFNFEQNAEYEGLYSPKAIELSFNGLLIEHTLVNPQWRDKVVSSSLVTDVASGNLV